MSDNPGRWTHRPFDLVLAVCLGGFILGWLTYDLPRTLGVETEAMTFYLESIDPYGRSMPTHLELISEMATVFYGPIYVVLLWGIWRSASWIWKLALPVSGLLIATTFVYMSANLSSATPPLNLPAFIGLNGFYIVFGLLLIARYTRSPRRPM